MRLMKLTQYAKSSERPGRPIAISPAHVMVIEPEPDGSGVETQITISSGTLLTVSEPYEKVCDEWTDALRCEYEDEE